jgi:hypothetical protein
MKWETRARWFVMLWIGFGLYLVGLKIGGATERMKAVEQGVAHWQVNEKTGETKFIYRKP